MVFDSSLTAYDFGPSHPMSPIRVDLTMRLARELGVLDRLTVVPAPFADDAQIATVHDAELIDAVTRAGKDPGSIGVDDHGLGTDDNPVFADMHLAAAHVVGASLEAFRQVQSGESLHSANIAGGLHHAMRDRSSGFCIYNDVAIGIQWLLDQGVERVAYVDVDVHHGDGVEAIFYDDPRVLTISLHETGQMLFPGTGFPGRLRRSGRRGHGGQRRPAARAPPTPAGCGPSTRSCRRWCARSRREVLVTQHGCDSHMEDPLAHLMLTVDGQRASYLALHDLAHEVCEGRWVATGGGGYALVEVVPARVDPPAGDRLRPAGRARRPTPPARWREHVRESLGRQAPFRMTDGRTPAWRDWSEGYDPAASLDRTIHATRTEVFPWHGLVPDL